jgi:acetyl esterase/lipase
LSFTFRKAIGLTLGAAAATMGGLIAAPTLHDRLWLGHALFSEFPWITSFVGGAGLVTSLARSPRSPWGALLATAGVGLSLLPLVRAREAMEDMNKTMLAGLGKNYEKQITPAMLERVSPHRWTAHNTLKWQYEFPNVNIIPDVFYSQPGLRPLKLDIYQPTEPPVIGKQYPAIITVHGGAWRSYDKGGVFVPHHSHLASQGYVVFDIQYRFSGEAVWPAQLQDLQCAIRWVRAHAHEYNIDPKRIALLGRSSGGHTALMAAYRPNDAKIGKTCYEDEDASVSAVVAYYPPTDVRLWQSIPGGAVYELLGGQIEDLPKAYADASPVEFVRDGLPPTMLIQGYMDELVQPVHVELLNNLLRGTNTPSVLLRVPWGRHVFDAVLSGMGAQLAQYHVDRFLAWNLYRHIEAETQEIFPGVPYQ